MKYFTVPGDPIPQGRPRFYRQGNRVITFDPTTSTNFKERIAFYATQAKITPMDGPVRLGIKFYFKRAKKYNTKKYSDLAIWKPSRPDMDNLIKAVMDALNGIAYKDDGQITYICCEKWMHSKGGIQRTEVTLSND